jgi:hypothetical protein
MKLAVFGSRSLVGKSVRAAIETALDANGATAVVTAGEPQGVCHEARTVAQERSLPLTLHWLQPKERAAGKYHWRSVAVLSDCDRCLFLHDGKSAGTRNEIKIAVKRGVAHEVVVMTPAVTTEDIADAIKRLKGGA